VLCKCLAGNKFLTLGAFDLAVFARDTDFLVLFNFEIFKVRVYEALLHLTPILIVHASN